MHTDQLSGHFGYRKLMAYTMPSVFMMLATSAYSVVDGYFVSNYLGANAFAALNLIMPVLMGMSVFGFMLGTGGSALVAKLLGEGQIKKANEIFSMLVMVIIAVGALLTALGYLEMPRIARWLGASDALLEGCVTYGRIQMAAEIVFMLQCAFQSFFVAAEKPGYGFFCSLAAGITNIVMDYLLICKLNFGIAGASWASALGQLAGGITPLVYFALPNTSRLRLVRAPINWRALWRACTNGVSELLSNLSGNLTGILYNLQLMRVAAENGVAAYGVIAYVNFVFTSFFFGYAIGVGPVVGYQYGAQNREELKSLLRKSLAITSAAALTFAFVSHMAARPLAELFVGYDAALCEMTAAALTLYSLSFLFSGFNIFGSAYFTGLNNGFVSGIISALRTLVIQVGAILLLPLVLGVNGIWLAVVVAESVTLVVTMAFFAANRRRYGYF